MQRAETILNFQNIIQQVTQFLTFAMSYDYLDKYLKVETSSQTVKKLHRYTQAFYDNQQTMPLPELLPLDSFQTIFQKLAAETTLTPKEGLAVANLYDNVQKLKIVYHKQIQQGNKAEQIEKLLDELILNESIAKEIRRVLTKDALVADGASAKLQTLRREQKSLEKMLRQALQQLMESAKVKLAENLYTLRNNRYVLPIKAEFKNTFAGILHDQSASGTTVYIEPQALVQSNNKLQELALQEVQEVERILRELSKKLFTLKDEIGNNTAKLARFDIYQAKALYARAHHMRQVEIVDAQIIELYDAKHPLLQNGKTVGNDILLGDGYNLLMITGSNTGGKSVFLKTIGLLSMMAQAGLFLPVTQDKKNRLGVFNQILIAIGDEQSLEQNLSTFSGHIALMKSVLQQTDKKTLVLLDELGNGTDPVQGSALAIAMLETLVRKEALIVATTHFDEVKWFTMQAPYAENASLIFDVATLKPTYKLRYGSVGSSHAFAIAEALQLPRAIIESAKAHAAAFADERSELLTAYEQKREALDKQKQLLDAKEANLTRQMTIIETKMAQADVEIAQKRQEILKQTEKQLTKKLQQAESILEEIKEKQAFKQNEYADIKGQLNRIAAPTEEKMQAKAMHAKAKVQRDFAIGDVMYVEALQAKGTLVKKQGKKWTVKIGKLTIALPENELVFLKKGAPQKKERQEIRKRVTTVADTLDLRGLRVQEGIDALERYLANAVSLHQVVKIIHGHGTGQMRQAVQDVLRQTKTVKSFRFGGEGEGGVGATIVTFY